MKDDNAKRPRANRVWLTADACDPRRGRRARSSLRSTARIILASDVVSNVPTTTGSRRRARPPLRLKSRKELLAEWVDAFIDVRHHRHPQRVPRLDRDR